MDCKKDIRSEEKEEIDKLLSSRKKKIFKKSISRPRKKQGQNGL